MDVRRARHEPTRVARVNVRFAAGAVRCRITQGEMDELLRVGSLRLTVALPRNHHFQVTVCAAALAAWQLDTDPTGLWIQIPRTEIVQLQQALPSREGIAHAFELDAGGQVQVSLEVDVRKRREKTVPS
jgi:hypothetical protein